MATHGSAPILDVVVRVHGGPARVSDLAYARRKVASVVRLAPGPVVSARAEVVMHEDPARPRPISVKAEIDVDGDFVRAHATATTVAEAVDLVEAKLRRRIARMAARPSSTRARHRERTQAWHHGDEPTARADFYPRPPEEREVVRRKTFACGTLSPNDAALELERLDHDFYLFTNSSSGDDNLLLRVHEGKYELIGRGSTEALGPGIEISAIRPSKLTTDEAVEQLDLSGRPFVFFVDAISGRGRVVYRRYDGHYGLITPAHDVP
jgi:ribosome-associated translation inhibitor RaiA